MARKKGKSAGTRYRKTVTIGHDLSGNAIRKDFYAPTKRELTEKIDRFKLNQMTGAGLNDEKITFSAWAQKWFQTYKKGHLEKSSERTQYGVVKSAIEFFGEAPIMAIRESDIVQYFNAKSKLKKNTLQLHYVVLHQLFKKAVSNNVIPHDPMRDLKPPSGQKSKPRRAYSLEQYKKVLEIAKSHSDGLGIFIMLKTGIRIAELMGLKGSDFNFEKGLLKISRTLTDEDGLKSYGKTASAIRTIPLDPESINYLKSRQEFKKDDLIFGGIYPQYYRVCVYEKFKKYLAEKYPDIPTLTPHELRHTYGTLLYQAGTNLLTISRIMGHSSLSTTQKIYVHDTLDDVIKNVKFPG